MPHDTRFGWLWWSQAASVTFPPNYFASGTISLPYGGITEPYSVWYDSVNGLQKFNYCECERAG